MMQLVKGEIRGDCVPREREVAHFYLSELNEHGAKF